MEAWVIVLITISSGIALFAIIFTIKKKWDQKREASFQSRTTVIQVSQPPYPQQPPYNFGQNHPFPQQSHQAFSHPPIPSTTNQGIFNHQNPHAHNPNTSNFIQMNNGMNPRFAPTMAPGGGTLTNPGF